MLVPKHIVECILAKRKLAVCGDIVGRPPEVPSTPGTVDAVLYRLTALTKAAEYRPGRIRASLIGQIILTAEWREIS